MLMAIVDSHMLLDGHTMLVDGCKLMDWHRMDCSQMLPEHDSQRLGYIMMMGMSAASGMFLRADGAAYRWSSSFLLG